MFTLRRALSYSVRKELITKFFDGRIEKLMKLAITFAGILQHNLGIKFSSKMKGEKMKTVSITAYPYVVQYGEIEVPNDVFKEGESSVRKYIEENFNEIMFGIPDVDYEGTDFDIDYDEEE